MAVPVGSAAGGKFQSRGSDLGGVDLAGRTADEVALLRSGARHGNDESGRNHG
jgi:hypothetical protein